ncbi:uncharacterized protein LOC127777458 [Oryza glaberrima]|uniref:uncharacterized protein LOC127777458 n=1 Tax=Oryza glaberrima TaxID=4538 RepID=UPI00224C2533|nr:uncharacterized protein LOC127777458 [Oryza glaberrima]
MEATSRASNTNNHPAATANEGMLSSSSASTTRLSTGRQSLLAPGRRQLLLRLPRRDGDSRSARIRRSRPSPSRDEYAATNQPSRSTPTQPGEQNTIERKGQTCVHMYYVYHVNIHR